jgi:hypothetical protein
MTGEEGTAMQVLTPVPPGLLPPLGELIAEEPFCR